MYDCVTSLLSDPWPLNSSHTYEKMWMVLQALIYKCKQL